MLKGNSYKFVIRTEINLTETELKLKLTKNLVELSYTETELELN